jgi:hypothetical protein
MKKKLLIFAVAGLALASCSSDETTASLATSGANEVSFRPLNTGVTRAADASFNATSGTAQFKVTAFKNGEDVTSATPYFSEVEFKGNGTSSWVSDVKYYWPNTYNLDFYAWAPASYTPSSYSHTGFLIEPGTTIGSQPDFVYAVTRNWGKASGAYGSGANGVTINFRHAESKVVIQLKNDNNDLKITVGNVAINNLYGSGTFTWNGVTDGSNPVAAETATTNGKYTSGTLTYLNGTWNTGAATQTTDYSVAMGTDEITTGIYRNVFSGTAEARNLTSTASGYEMILIPQTVNVQTTYSGTTAADATTHLGGSSFDGTYISAQIKIQQKSNDEYIVGSADTYITAMWPLTSAGSPWLPGHKYTYTVNLGNGGYYDNNQDTNTNLDPILAGAEIFFATVTVDAWGNGGDTGVTNP